MQLSPATGIPAALLLGLSLGTGSHALQSALPDPEEVLGHAVGADFHLASYEESLAYFERLAAADGRLRLEQVGVTTYGRPFHVAFLSSEANLAALERQREISLRLAHPDGLSDGEARALAREGRALVHVDGGLHATEVAGAQHTIQLAHDLLAGAEGWDTEAILDEVVLMLWPSLNPDGQTLVADWYRANLGTPYEIASMPQLYQAYVGHDNNRDAYMLNMVESRVVGRTWRRWEPQIIFVHHQTAPFPTRIWLPPFSEPIGSRTHPLLTRTVNSIGMLMAQALEERGQVGATHKGNAFDAWYPGYVDYLPNFQNAAAFWTETALYEYATPHFYTVDDFPTSRRGLRSESLYASPWKGGWWRLGDAVDYMLTASLACLDYAAKYRENLLYNRYQAGRDAIARYRGEPPFAYFVPADQRDPVAPVELLRRLAFNGVRVQRLAEEVELGGRRHPAGTWVIPMDQEYAELVRQLFDVQEYPDLRESPEGPVARPYDAAAWTLPYLMDVRVVAAMEPLPEAVRRAMVPVAGEPVDWRRFAGGGGGADPAPFDSVPAPGFDTDPVAAGIVPPPGEITGMGPVLRVEATQNNAFRAIQRVWRGGGVVGFEPGGGPDAPGAFLLQGLDESGARGLVAELHLRARRTAEQGARLAWPRVGLYRPWDASMDEGWTRWLLERYEIDFQSVRNADFQAGDLGERFDVLLFADLSRRAILEGFERGSVPSRYEGGLGAVGVRALDGFVRGGGTLVCLNRSSGFAVRELRLPVEDVLAEVSRDDFFAGGSILSVEVNAAHAVMAGMPERAAVFFDRSPAFEPGPGFRGEVLARYADGGSPLLSGYLYGEEHLHGRAAALAVEHGEGRVVLLGFRPQWRGQPSGTFRVLFNALLYLGQPGD